MRVKYEIAEINSMKMPQNRLLPINYNEKLILKIGVGVIVVNAQLIQEENGEFIFVIKILLFQNLLLLISLFNI